MNTEHHDILAYLKGTMSDEDRFAFEKRMLEDPMLNDAVEGFQQMPVHEVEAILGMQDIPQRNNWTPWLVAASLAILALSVVFILLDDPVTDESVSRIIAEDSLAIEQAPEVVKEVHTDPAEELEEEVVDEPEMVEKPDPVEDREEDPVVLQEQEAILSEVEPQEEVGISEDVLAQGVAAADVEEVDAAQPVSESANKKMSRSAKALVQPSGGIVVAEQKPVEGVNIFMEGGGGTLSASDGSFVMESISYVQVVKNGYEDQRLEPGGLLQLTRAVEKMEYEVTTANIYDLFPQPETGRSEYLQYLNENLKYPTTARSENITGVVTLEFKIKKNGNLSDFVILSPLSTDCDQEAIRLVREGPTWTAGIVSGRRVVATVVINVLFSL